MVTVNNLDVCCLKKHKHPITISIRITKKNIKRIQRCQFILVSKSSNLHQKSPSLNHSFYPSKSHINGNSRILNWRYCTISLAIFCGDIPLPNPQLSRWCTARTLSRCPFLVPAAAAAPGPRRWNRSQSHRSEGRDQECCKPGKIWTSISFIGLI